MKIIKKIFFFIITCFIFTSSVNAQEKNIVNLYLFHSKTCTHCQAEIKLLNELVTKYDNLRVYQYEVSSIENSNLLEEVTKIFNVNISGVPFTVIGEKTYNGYNPEYTKKTFEAVIEYYSYHGYQDKVGELIQNIELPSYPPEDNSDIDNYIDDYGNHSIDIPLVGPIETKNLSIPILTIVMGLLDGFNPCAMWVLLFLITMLINMKDKKRMWTLGLIFLITSAVMYGLFMMAWLNVASLISSITILRILIASIAIIGGSINLISFFKTKTSGCNVVNDKKRNKIFSKIKKFTQEKNLIIAIIGVITVAITVNIVELACSSGLPVMFLQILSLNNLSSVESSIYIIFYLFFFLLDDIIVFTIAMLSLKVTGISTKFGKISKLIGGIILLIMGLLLIIKPEWLMFNF